MQQPWWVRNHLLGGSENFSCWYYWFIIWDEKILLCFWIRLFGSHPGFPSPVIWLYTLLLKQSVLSLSGITSLTPWSIQRALLGICDEIHKGTFIPGPRAFSPPSLDPWANWEQSCHPCFQELFARKSAGGGRWLRSEVMCGLATSLAIDKLLFKFSE